MNFYRQSIDETLQAVDSDRDGLTSQQAAKRLATDGPNIVEVKGTPLWRLIVQPFANVMIGVLFVATAISLWQHEYVDAIIIFAIIMASAIIDWVQQYSTARILRSLKKREQNRVEVYRDGKVSTVLAENLVRGDLIIMSEGQKIPADARLIEAEHLHVDESMLTGESLSIRKTPTELRGEKPIYEQTNMLFSGSFVVTGAGVAVITATNNETEFGKLAELAGDVNYTSPLQQKIDKLIRIVVIVVFAMAGLAFLLQLARGIELVEALRFVLAFAVSAVPEGLPIAITVVLALGMKRMAAKKALVRNMRAIENIGLVTTIATDKTGTLTRNELRVRDTWSPRFNPAAFALQTSFALNISKGKTADPLDTALSIFLKSKKVEAPKSELIQSLPFDYQSSMSGNIWKFGKNREIFVKGAPEKVIEKCKMTATEKAIFEKKLHEFTGSGFRVIAFAKGETTMSAVGKFFSLKKLTNQSLEFLGLVAIADELRPRVESAVREATNAGVRVRMITGDHAETAYHIAREIHIAEDPEQVYDSRKLMRLKPAKLHSVVEATRVYARVIPEAKHKILTELNRTDITAMTGDGVNDVPALTQAHVGVAMGAGSAIAKDASDIVLLDNNFKSIVTAIREGRIIIANVRRMLVYLLATNAGEVLVMIGALLIGLPLPLVAVQILWVNLATDTFMVIPLGLEPGDKKIMKQKPADPRAPILNKFLMSRVIMTAVIMAIVTLGIFAIFLHRHSVEEARSAAFLALITIQWINALSMRSEAPLHKIFKVKNRVFFWALTGAIILQVAIMFVPALRSALHLEQIHADSIWACLIGMVIMGLALELHKYIGRKMQQKV
ncbi:cation-transporting P-type ATPase [Candidatus Saccharibacteria bacterium]|nr:cation-transporting P-type ATPase [Candidatus Saccharibacteria bacterium]